MHHTKQKGDIAVAKVILDLTNKEYYIFAPVISEHLPFDLIAYKNEITYRLQVKHVTNDYIKPYTSWSDKNGAHSKGYQENDFDYYALYYPNIDKILYPNISFKGCTIASETRNSAKPFYWWEDFQNFTDKAEKKTYKDFNITLTKNKKMAP